MIFGLFLLAFVCGVGVYSAPPRFKLIAWSIASVYVGILLYIYISFIDLPSEIRLDAERIAIDQPYCLSLPHLHRPVGQSLDLTILRARGNGFTPHLMLWVKGGEGTTSYNWSHRKRHFDRNLINGVVQNCIPRQGFLTALKPPKPGTYFVMGRNTYIFPPEHDARNTNDNIISLRFGINHDIGGVKDSVMFDPSRVDQWQKGEMARKTFPADHSGIFKVDGLYGFTIWKFDGSGLPVERFSCGSGTGCRMTFVFESKLFDVFLPPIDAEKGSMVRSRIEDIWQSFRVEDGASMEAPN
ncbi:MAG: hypothetical protein KAT26_09045 [Marinosulfonomonas sp.]|nr:hypothetical protein [Marinosulfonomonas sp.]